MKRQYFLLTAFVVATTLTYHPVTAAKPGATTPTIVDLGTLGGTFSDAFGINNDPNDVQVVGIAPEPMASPTGSSGPRRQRWSTWARWGHGGRVRLAL